jgi:hypothetical protein
MRAVAGWGVLGAVAARWAMKNHPPGTQPDTIGGKVSKDTGSGALENVVGYQVRLLSGTTVIDSDDTGTDGTFQFTSVSVGTYVVTVTPLQMGLTIPDGQVGDVSIVAPGQAISFTIDFVLESPRG